MNAAKKYFQIVLLYEAIIALFSLYVVLKSGSTVIIFPTLMAVSSVVSVMFVLYILQTAEKGNTNLYPYGTGRLEDAMAFFSAVLMTVGIIIPLHKVFNAFYTHTYHAPQLGWAVLVLFFAVLGQCYLYLLAKRTIKENASPMIAMSLKCYKVASLRDFITFSVILFFLLFDRSNETLMFWVDQLCTIVLGIYAITQYVPSVWIHFRSLVDFPLSEADQLKIMSLLTKYYDEYEMLGNIYSTNKGSTRIVEIELEFSPGMIMSDFLDLERRMYNDFKEIFSDGRLKILPLTTAKA